MPKFTPLIKGLITAGIMIIVSLAFYFSKLPGDSYLQYLVYILYAAGIAWAVIDYSRSSECTGKFVDYFSTGFKCFIVVTLLMVVFTFIMFKMHPEYATEAANQYRISLQNEKTHTPAEIEEKVAIVKKQFVTYYVSTAIFGYLIFGAIVTAVTTGVLLTRRK